MDADKLNLLGHRAMQLGKIDKALEYFQKAVKVNSLLPHSHYNVGVCYMAWGQYDLAIENYIKALKLSPKNTVILNNLGVTYDKMDLQYKALEYYQKALKVEPQNVFALSNIGSIYLATDIKKAVHYLKKAIKINPHLADAHFNLGVANAGLGRVEALENFKKALSANPNYSPTWGHYHHQLRNICDFKKAADLEKTINGINDQNIIDGILPSQTPFESIVYNDNPKINFDIARIWSNYIAEKAVKCDFVFKKTKSIRKIRVGYLSCDFGNHATTHLISGVLKNHNRNEFEIFSYSYGVDSKDKYGKLVKTKTSFRDIRNLSDSQAAKFINRDKIDILVDLKGYTQGARLGILATKPAPVIVTWLGFPGTTGAKFIDYAIVDQTVIPKNHRKYYSENLIFLPHSYQPTDNSQETLGGIGREQFQIPDSSFIFCSFNKVYKIDPLTFMLWMRILRKVPKSHLVLLKDNSACVKNLKREAKRKGVNPNRLIFVPRIERNAHLARLKLCDLALDTIVCNGHTTTSDCLWAGVPVVTLLGKHFASRVSASLLSAVGIPELITNSPKEYENLAVSFANPPKGFKKLEVHKEKLEAFSKTFPLFDTLRFTKNLEQAYKKIWEINKAGKLPESIILNDPISKETLSTSWSNMAAIMHDRNDNSEAVKYAKKAISLNPKNSLAYNNLGTIYRSTGKVKQALFSWEKAHKLDSNLTEPISNLGIYHLDTGNPVMARVYFEKLISINPKDANAWGNIGISYINQSNYPDAIKCLVLSVKYNPLDFTAFYHLGLTYRLCENFTEAIKSLKKSLSLNPEFGPALNIYSLLLMQICDWNNFKKVSAKIPPESESPLINVARSQDEQFNFEVAKLRSTEIKKEVANIAPKFSYRSNTQGKIKIGYISRDFFNHATAYLILGLFKAHDRDKFEIFTYSYGPDDNSVFRKKLEKDADQFVDITSLDYLKAAEKINRDGVDILVDLKGHTKDNRLEIMALKPSPIQVSWLGFPGTTGADFIDYIITDKIVTPPESAKYYTEQFAYMPHCYQINDKKREISKTVYRRSDWGLPESEFIFSCFNQSGKIDQETFSSWMRILKKVPGSVLWLLSCGKLAEGNLKKEAQKAKVNPLRLIFASHIPVSQHLARIKLSDLALDTFTYNGHTTTSDSLWAGVPVVTRRGGHFASRVASSILTAVGLPELITQTSKEFENLAVTLAKSPKLLKSLKDQLQKNRFQRPLFNTESFVKDLERVYQKIWQHYILRSRKK